MKYFYKKLGKVVEVEQMFDSHWNYFDPQDGTPIIRHGLVEDFAPLELEKESETVDASSIQVEVIPPQPEEIKTPTPGFVKLINLNTETSPAVIALHLPGIGKIWAKKICDRRPKVSGYKDFDHFKKINSDLHLDDDGWEKIKELVEF